MLVKQCLIFLAGMTVAASESAAAVSLTSSSSLANDDEAEEAVADDYSTVEVVTSHTYGTAEDNQYAPMEGEVISNGG